MRHQLGFSSPTNCVTKLLIAIISIYLITAISSKTSIGYLTYSYLVLNPSLVLHEFQVWRLFSYAFLHDLSSPMHVVINCLMLYMMGPSIENMWGEKKFFRFVVSSILLGGVVVLLAYLLNLSMSSVIGFSAVSIGLIIVWGLTFPKDYIYIFGVFPLSGKNMVIFTIILEILYAFSGNNVSTAAHFGGILCGFIFVFGLYKLSNIKFYIRHFSNKRRFK